MQFSQTALMSAVLLSCSFLQSFSILTPKLRNLCKPAKVSIFHLLLYSQNMFMRKMQLEMVWERVLITTNCIIMSIYLHCKSIFFYSKAAHFLFLNRI